MPKSTPLVNIHALAEETGLCVRTLRSLKDKHKIPFLRLGHRTVRFDPERVRDALRRFEVKEVS